MADTEADNIAKRRELRRRKILENSEDRLRKLTNIDRTRSKGKLDLKEELNEQNTITSNRDAISKETVTNSTHYRNLHSDRHNFHGDTTDEDEEEHFSSTRSEPHTQTGNIHVLPKILTENKTCSKAKLDSNRSTFKPSNSLQAVDFILLRKWLCLMLAILGRMLGYLLEGTQLTKGVTLLFVMLEIALFSTELLSELNETKQRSQPQGVLVAALLLCGIRNATRIVQVIELFIKLIEDVSIFFFTFFMCHWWIEAVY